MIDNVGHIANGFIDSLLNRQSDVQADKSLAAISDLINARTFDETSGFYNCVAGAALMIEILPLVGIDERGIGAWQAFLRDVELGDGFLTVMNWSSGRIGPELRNWEIARPADNVIRDARRDVFMAAAHDGLFAAQNWSLRRGRVFCQVQLSDHSDATLERLENIKGHLAKTCEAIGTDSRIVKPDALLGLLEELLLPDLCAIDPALADYSGFEAINTQLRDPGAAIKINWDGIGFETNTSSGSDTGVKARVYSVTKLPKTLPPGYTASLIGNIFNRQQFCPWPVLQSVTMSASGLNPDDISLRAGQLHKTASGAMRFLVPSARREYEDWSRVSEALVDDEKLASVLYQTVVYARPEQIDAAETSIKSLFDALGFELKADFGIQMVSFATCLPFGLNKDAMGWMQSVNRPRHVMEVNALALLPLFGEWRGNAWAKPPVMLLTGRRGQPLGFTPWESPTNYNVIFVGTSGGGKSVAMQEMMSGIMATGGSVIVLDDGRSFENSCTLLGGAHVDFDSAGLRLNPFAAIDAEAFNEAAEHDADDFNETVLSMLIAVLGSLARPNSVLSDEERAVLLRAINHVWHTKGNAGMIEDVVAALGAEGGRFADVLASLLTPYTSDGGFGRLFSDGCNVSLDSALTVFEMRALASRPEVRAGVIVLLIFLASQKMYRSPRGQRISIMIDEAWTLLSHGSAGFIETVARKGRKYNVSLCCASQSVADFFKNPAAEAAWNNAEWTLMFPQKSASIVALEKEQRIEVDAVLKKALNSLQSRSGLYSEMIIHGSSGWDIARLILDDVSLTAYSSSGADVAAIEGLIQTHGMSRMQAIAHYAGQIRQSNQGKDEANA